MTDWLLPLAAGFGAGILSAWGVGGGTLLLLVMTLLLDVPQQQAAAVNLLYFLPAGLMALPTHWKNGFVEKKALAPAIGAGLLCAAGAAWLSMGLEADLLRRLFGGFLLLVGGMELLGREKK